MNFKNLYFSLLAVLTGVLLSGFLASREVDEERYSRANRKGEFFVSVDGQRLPSDKTEVAFSPRIHAALNLPLSVSAILVLGGVAAESWGRKYGALVFSVRSNVQRVESHMFYRALGYEKTKTQTVYRKRTTKAAGQMSEPTSGSVTPRADAQVAPLPPAAHC